MGVIPSGYKAENENAQSPKCVENKKPNNGWYQ